MGEQHTHIGAVAPRGVAVELFGAAGNGAADAAELGVGVGGDDTVDALFEQFGERELQQRQRPGPGDDVADHRRHQARFEADTGPLGGQGDRVVELARCHRGDGEGGVTHDRAEHGVLQRPVVEVGAQGGDDADVVAAGEGGSDAVGEPVTDRRQR